MERNRCAKAESQDKAERQNKAEGQDKEMQYPAGIKWTRQRKSVYEVLKAAEEPFSAVQIYQHILQQERDVSYAVSTVYRILGIFEEKGMVIRENRIDDGSAVYELNHGGHTHYAVCLECHKRIPLKSCPFAHMHLGGEAEDFTVTGHKLELYGYCKDCRK